MAHWNGGDGENPGDLYYTNNASFQPIYYGYSYPEWCNQQQHVMVQNPYQEFVPSYVCHNTNTQSSGVVDGSGGNSDAAAESDNRPQTSAGAVSKQNGRYSNSSSKSGAARLYRNSHSDRSSFNVERAHRGGVSGGISSRDGENSKVEDKKKLLAEVANLLAPQNQNQVQQNQNVAQQQNQFFQNQQFQSSYNSKKSNGGRNNRAGQKQFNSRGPANQQQQTWNKGRSWAATPNPPKPYKNAKSRGGGSVLPKDVGKEPETQRERLVEHLTRGQLECLVCFEKLRQTDAIWSCRKCYHVLHLKCTSKWALTLTTTKAETGVTMSSNVSWRCPACQHNYRDLPTTYTCFCGRVNNPIWVKGETPHCCGDICSRTRDLCDHPCTLPCHPGPCLPCYASVVRQCGCGKSKQMVKCSSTISLECNEICNKKLDCGVHKCSDKCHSGPCKPCDVSNVLNCFCKANSRIVRCGHKEVFSCGEICCQQLLCGRHTCPEICHLGACKPCRNDLRVYQTCHCGRQPSERESCDEEVPSCGEPCPTPRSMCDHPCPNKCHRAPCPPCQVMVTTPCRCGHSQSMEAPCHKVAVGELPLCRKKCTKRRKCGKHKCNTECCDDTSHICCLPCNKNLSCGQHRCDRQCHAGPCFPCQRLTFDEMRCECGRTVLYPPIECGARLPECTGLCPRHHACAHPPTHTCHTQAECPPCTVLVSRECYGGHETRKAVACYIAEYSCGLPCGKPLSCGHRCPERCHGGECPLSCSQPCPKPRPSCQHPCSAPCHFGTPCPPAAVCPAPLMLTCPCGRRSGSSTCAEYWRTYGKVLAAAEGVASMAASGGVVVTTPSEAQGSAGVTNVVGNGPQKMNLRVLECDSECKLYERNLKLAIGLQIANPDLSNKLKPQYSDSMKAWAKKDPRFCEMVHNKLTQLVTLAKESKQRSRSYSFEVMGGNKRALVHEYCKHFGCESAAFDAEPKRNVVATAYKDKCWLPSYSLVEMFQRENGLRKPPGTVNTLLKPLSSDSSNREMVPLTRSLPAPVSSGTPAPPVMDYFDMTPTSL